jgi:hypothetical protein
MIFFAGRICTGPESYIWADDVKGEVTFYDYIEKIISPSQILLKQYKQIKVCNEDQVEDIGFIVVAKEKITTTEGRILDFSYWSHGAGVFGPIDNWNCREIPIPKGNIPHSSFIAVYGSTFVQNDSKEAKEVKKLLKQI